MTTELEQEFYNTFGIEPKIDYDYKTIIQNVTKTGYWFDKEYLIKMFNDNQKFKVMQVRKNINYPDITAEKLLEMICIYNEFQNNCDYLVVPINIKTFKDDFLKIMIKSVNDKYMNTYFCNDDKKLKTKIQQLFSEK